LALKNTYVQIYQQQLFAATYSKVQECDARDGALKYYSWEQKKICRRIIEDYKLIVNVNKMNDFICVKERFSLILE
jgi:hypothetical protein